MTPIEAGAPNGTAGNRRPVQLPATQSSSRGPSCRAYLMGFSASWFWTTSKEDHSWTTTSRFEASDPARKKDGHRRGETNVENKACNRLPQSSRAASTHITIYLFGFICLHRTPN